MVNALTLPKPQTSRPISRPGTDEDDGCRHARPHDPPHMLRYLLSKHGSSCARCTACPRAAAEPVAGAKRSVALEACCEGAAQQHSRSGQCCIVYKDTPTQDTH